MPFFLDVLDFLHASDDFEQSERSQQAQNGKFHVEEQEDVRDDDNDAVKRVDKVGQPAEPVREQLEDDLHDEKGQQDEVQILENVLQSVIIANLLLQC